MQVSVMSKFKSGFTPLRRRSNFSISPGIYDASMVKSSMFNFVEILGRRYMMI